MSVREGFRPIETGVHTDFRKAMSYADYLELDTLLAAQHPRSDPPHHDELLFIVQHQTTELWLKLILHELRGARAYLDADHVHHALKCLARVKHIQRTLTEQWSVLATLTPSEYAEFRGTLGTRLRLPVSAVPRGRVHPGQQERAHAQGFRTPIRRRTPCCRSCWISRRFTTPSCAFWLAADSRFPTRCCNVTCDGPGSLQPALIPVFQSIYDAVDRAFDLYEACESLVDVEDNFQFWRFRHLRTVQRTIGFKTGTGGSSGVRLLAEGAGPDLLSRALRGPDRDRQVTPCSLLLTISGSAIDSDRRSSSNSTVSCGRSRSDVRLFSGLVCRGLPERSCLASPTGMSTLVWSMPLHSRIPPWLRFTTSGWVPRIARSWKINSPTGGLVKIAGPFLTAVGGYPLGSILGSAGICARTGRTRGRRTRGRRGRRAWS